MNFKKKIEEIAREREISNVKRMQGGRKHRSDSAQEIRLRLKVSRMRAKINRVYTQTDPQRKLGP